MRIPIIAMFAAAIWVHPGEAQGLREVPQRFIYVEPVGLLFGIGTVGLEFATGRTASVEIRGLGVYAKEDGVEVYGGGGGLGLRKYFGGAEHSGFMLGAFGDGVYLTANNFRVVSPGHIAAGGFRAERGSFYFGLGGLSGYRFLSQSGFFLEPQVSYQYFFGPRPLVAGADHLLQRLGFTLGLALGTSF